MTKRTNIKKMKRILYKRDVIRKSNMVYRVYQLIVNKTPNVIRYTNDSEPRYIFNDLVDGMSVLTMIVDTTTENLVEGYLKIIS